VTGLPRFLPLVAVAAVGVLAINLVENGPGIIGAARSFAEGVAPKAAGAKSDTALPADASVADPAVVAAKPAPVCAPTAQDLAKEAGLSPAELQVLQSLGDRRGQLDEREQGLDTQVNLIAAAEAKVDAKIATMNQLKTDMQTLLGQLDDKQQAEVDRLVKVYEAMKPADSAARFVLLNDEVRLPIAAKMKERALSAMIAKMPPPEAKRLTESLAARYVAQADAAKAALNPPPAAAAATTPPATPAKPPAQLAAANPPPAAPAAPPKPVHRKPHTVHHPAAAADGATASAAAKPTTPAATKPLASAAGGATPPPTKPATAAPKTPAPAATTPSSPPPAKTG
jgi:flagellar motility protein MotE (MotC chaperone)